VNPAKGIVTGKLVSIQMGANEDNGMKPGMINGLRASNEAMTKWWNCEYIGGSRDDGYLYKLTGGPISEQDFPINGAIRIWEIGDGDTAKLATFAGIRRHPVFEDLCEITANVPFRIAIPEKQFPGTLEVSTDRITWTPLKTRSDNGMVTIEVSEETLGSGYLYLRTGNGSS
jgi:hypothetical protein